jgi:hypothetical protein
MAQQISWNLENRIDDRIQVISCPVSEAMKTLYYLDRMLGVNTGFLSRNTALPWSLELIERFVYRREWPAISRRTLSLLPLLRSADIGEIMVYNFSAG